MTMTLELNPDQKQALIPIIDDFIKSRNIHELLPFLNRLKITKDFEAQIHLSDFDKTAILIVLYDVLEACDSKVWIHITNLKLRYQVVTKFEDQHSWFQDYLYFCEEREFYKDLIRTVNSCSPDE